MKSHLSGHEEPPVIGISHTSLFSLRVPLKFLYPFIFLLGSQICAIDPECLWGWLYGKKEETIPGNLNRIDNLLDCERQRTAPFKKPGREEGMITMAGAQGKSNLKRGCRKGVSQTKI